MSFSDPSFLLSQRKTDNEREAERLLWERRCQSVKRCYRLATWIVTAFMAWVVLPTGLGAYTWHVVSITALILIAIAVRSFWLGAWKQGMLTLVFAFAILPGWVHFFPNVMNVARELWTALFAEWHRVFGR